MKSMKFKTWFSLLSSQVSWVGPGPPDSLGVSHSRASTAPLALWGVCGCGAPAASLLSEALGWVLLSSYYRVILRQPLASLILSAFSYQIRTIGASLVAQWLGICLPMQGTRVRALVWEDPTCRGAAGPVSHNYWACAPQQEEAAIVRGPRTAVKGGPRLPQLEKALAQRRGPNTAINK